MERIDTRVLRKRTILSDEPHDHDVVTASVNFSVSEDGWPYASASFWGNIGGDFDLDGDLMSEDGMTHTMQSLDRLITALTEYKHACAHGRALYLEAKAKFDAAGKPMTQRIAAEGIADVLDGGNT